jgi:PTS system nitrogen regulatory IIA component
MSNQHEGDALQNELLTVQEVADYLRVSRVTAWRWCQQGTIPAFRIGRNWRIRRDKLLELEGIAEPDHHGPDGKELQTPGSSKSEDRLVALKHGQRDE